MVSKWVITPIHPIYKEVITNLLTIDPNFHRDIQVDIWGGMGLTRIPKWIFSQRTICPLFG